MSTSGWLRYARLIEEAGADALELNVYHVAADARESGTTIEKRIMDLVKQVRKSVRLPLAVKLSPFFTSIPQVAMELRAAGADGLVLFNRFYQPDIDLEALEVVPQLHLSNSSELLLRLRWLAILSGRCSASLAATGGVHTSDDAIKAIMAGAHAVQIVSALLKHGPQHLKVVLNGMVKWMEQNEYVSIKQMQGSLSLTRCADPSAFERGNYMRVITSRLTPA
jgi:dihydroorotate dehydrogenase (fumarate)